ncbi:MarR family winged helix-turn-helix transcriptional regulator [Clostridium paraputrificum]|uniref:MarR family winged helix-turn-helix transcriptional regulator n=1 Tax=Clostridium paraputrificum TaxID=29363 RepID=UPI003D348D1E
MKIPRSIGFEVKCVSNLIKRNLDEEYIKRDMHDLTGMQGWILKFINANSNKDIFQKDIEKEFRIRRSTATGMLQLLEKNGYIKRESVESDARLKKLVLTPKAIIAIEELENILIEFNKHLHEGISEEEKEIFFAIVDKVKKNLD